MEITHSDNVIRMRTAQSKERPNYWLRRLGVAAALAGTVTVGAVLVNAGERLVHSTDTKVPTAGQVKDHPNDYIKHVVQAGETKFSIASQYTDHQHDPSAGVDALNNQLHGKPLAAGDTVEVPVTTIPPEDR